jgi:hypothetical protein
VELLLLNIQQTRSWRPANLSSGKKFPVNHNLHCVHYNSVIAIPFIIIIIIVVIINCTRTSESANVKIQWSQRRN